MEIQEDSTAVDSQVDCDGAIDLSGKEFGDLLIEIEAEAQSLGPESIARNAFFKERALLAGLRCDFTRSELSRVVEGAIDRESR